MGETKQPNRPWSETTALTTEEHGLLGLVELSKELSTPLDLYGLAEIGLLNLMGSLGTRSAALWVLPHGKEKPCVLLRSFGLSDKIARMLGALCSTDLLDLLDGSTAPVFVDDLDDVLTEKHIDEFHRHKISLVSAVMSREGLLGIVALGQRMSDQEFSRFQLRVVEAALFHLGVALENSVLYSSLHENNRMLRQAKESLEAHDALQREFLSNLDHELRTPLTVMLSYLDVIQDQIEESELKEQVDIVVDQGQRLKSMILGLLDFSDVDRGTLRMNLETANLVPSMERYFEERRPGVARNFREFVLVSRVDDLRVEFDENRFYQVLDSLVDNVEKFTPEGTRLGLRLDTIESEGKSWARVALLDDGPGIPADKLDSIFDLFRQVDGSMTRTVGGMGMGLPLARALIERMGGTLEVKSAQGRGTSCTIHLPLVTEESLAPPESMPITA